MSNTEINNFLSDYKAPEIDEDNELVKGIDSLEMYDLEFLLNSFDER